MFKFSPPPLQYLDLKTGSSIIQNPKTAGIWKKIFQITPSHSGKAVLLTGSKKTGKSLDMQEQPQTVRISVLNSIPHMA